MKSWIQYEATTHFPIQNIPFGIYTTPSKSKRVGCAIGNYILDLATLVADKYLEFPRPEVLLQDTLNDFIALGKDTTSKFRLDIQHLLHIDNHKLQSNSNKVSYLDSMSEATMYMPVSVKDYTDFYSSIDHATNVGKMFRDPENALLPNWRHLPVGYHGRASSIVVSGTEVHRPKGQSMPKGATTPIFGPSQRLDFELEVAFIVGKPTNLGESVSVKNAYDHIFGLVLFNDLSARDIQAWEYVPLGPFLAKNFASVISPWVVTLEALAPFSVPQEPQSPEVLDYLKYEGNYNFDINLEVIISNAKLKQSIVQSNFKFMYWSMAQQLAHHTVNGCNLNVGDMMASGTISGPEPHQFGSMLELAWQGTKPLKMNDGTERTFLLDHDVCTLIGYAQADGFRIGFGECTTKILPAT
ncbi:MAG: fumarylacetoacetase [Chitinophagales bacterium]|jgi:fumarylacetoacetase|nr:fumarylacetoacetase [Chitinophagales bacterium]